MNVTEQMIEAERIPFETWCKGCGLSVTKIMEAYDTRLSYASAYVQGRWDAWLARAEIAATALSQAEGAPDPIAIVVSAHGDPEAFGEREIEVLADLSKIPYDTKLFALPTRPREQEGADPVIDDGEFWCRLFGKALDALDECAGDDEDDWDRQAHAEKAAEALRAQYKSRAHPLPAASFQAGAVVAWLQEHDGLKERYLSWKRGGLSPVEDPEGFGWLQTPLVALRPGWALVPIEPTPEMLRAYRAALKRYIDALPDDVRLPGKRGLIITDDIKARVRFAAMCEAAPTTPAKTEGAAA